MADSEQQAGEQRAIDRHAALVIEIIDQTQEVNKNLGAILNRTDTVVRRQNWLTVLFIASMVLNVLHLALGLSMSQLQQSAKAQLTAVDFGREELLAAVKEAKHEVQGMREELAAVRTQLLSVPMVKSDNRGRISLELPIDSNSAKPTAEQQVVTGTANTPDKLVIPLKTQSASRVLN